MVSVSIVLYKTPSEEIKKIVDLVLKIEQLAELHIIDNGPVLSDELWESEKVFLHHRPNNPGYGSAHNVAIARSIECSIPFHLVLNTDVYFDPQTISLLLDFMVEHPKVGISTPKVLSEDSSDQLLCKFLPTPLDLISRLLPFSIPFTKDLVVEPPEAIKVLHAPFLSGCCMLFRTEGFNKVGIFDEQFFMYMEDLDISRRFSNDFKCAMLCDLTIVHGYRGQSKKSLRMFWIHMISAIRYFNKWGWWFDTERFRINQKAIELNASNAGIR